MKSNPKNNIVTGTSFVDFSLFIKKTLPLTVITVLVYLFSIDSLNNYYELNETIFKVIFIALLSLTFPHILLEYLVDKNEK